MKNDSTNQSIEYSEVKAFEHLDNDALEEILACMEDSDRYTYESKKNRIMVGLKNELVKRGLEQYKEKSN